MSLSPLSIILTNIFYCYIKRSFRVLRCLALLYPFLLRTWKTSHKIFNKRQNWTRPACSTNIVAGFFSNQTLHSTWKQAITIQLHRTPTSFVIVFVTALFFIRLLRKKITNVSSIVHQLFFKKLESRSQKDSETFENLKMWFQIFSK